MIDGDTQKNMNTGKVTKVTNFFIKQLVSFVTYRFYFIEMKDGKFRREVASRRLI